MSPQGVAHSRIAPAPVTLSPPSLPTLRRSSRSRTVSERAQQYLRTINGSTDVAMFPKQGDDILVRWIISDEEVWWPATVVSIVEHVSDQASSEGELHYHRFRNYTPEHCAVHFYFDTSTQERSVTSNLLDDRSDTSLCSWLFPHELHETHTTKRHSNEARDTRKFKTVERPSSPSSSRRRASLQSPKSNQALISRSRALSSAIQKRGTSDQTSPVPKENKGLSKTSVYLRRKSNKTGTPSVHSTETRARQESDHTLNCSSERSRGNDDQVGGTAVQMVATTVQHQQDIPQSSTHPHSGSNLQLCIELLERKMQDVRQSPLSNPSSSAQSVIVTLKWAILRLLERPLKDLKLPDLSEFGIAAYSTNVSVQCDYSTFRELSASLASRHAYTSTSGNTGRLAFSPSFDTIQAGSVAADNLTVIFSTLADVTDFLRMRDELDYESVLVKELVDKNRSFLRLIGTFRIHEDTSGGGKLMESRVSSSNSSGAQSISVVSDKTYHKNRRICLYVASAPVSVTHKAMSTEQGQRKDIESEQLSTILIEQKCEHFSTTSKAFQSQWTVSPGFSNFKVCCTFDLDGIVRPSQLNNYFTLSWTRLQSPSTKKWTRDIHNIGINSPGTLCLSLPSIFLSSPRNVSDLGSIMDNNIETFMDVRSKIYRSSSFC